MNNSEISTITPLHLDTNDSAVNVSSIPSQGRGNAILVYTLTPVVIIVCLLSAILLIMWALKRSRMDKLRQHLMPMYSIDPSDSGQEWEVDLLSQEVKLDVDNSKMAANETLTITFVDASLSVFCFTFMVFVCGGNIMTIVAISRTEALRTLANIYVTSLAVADLFVGLSFSMLIIFMLPPYKNIYFDNNINLCVFMQGIPIGNMVTSVFHMTLISFDRYIYITRPYYYQRVFTRKNILLTIFAIWTFGTCMSIMPQFVYNSFTELEDRDCDLRKTLPKWFFTDTSTILFGINIIIAIFMYSQILRAALRQRKAIMPKIIPAVVIARSVRSESNNNRSGKTWKNIKFFFTVFGCYFVCITPGIITTNLDVYATGLVPETIVRAIYLIAMLNSGMNFIIYAVFNKQFKQAFADIPKCRPSNEWE